ncbi:MAG: amino acid permease [Planctomycetes bacterium]|nr:amino acid permease [Planctomycetota bacterium]
MAPSPLARLFRRKSVDLLAAGAEGTAGGLQRSLGPVELIALGIGAVVGAGIFASIGTAAAGEVNAAGEVVRPGAGPAIVLSFLLTGVACSFAALCYAEMASMIPVSGSAYTYAFATLGELVAWIIGWDLLLEYAVGNIGVAISWSDYFQSFLRSALGWQFPRWLGTGTLAHAPAVFEAAPRPFGFPIVLNLPAAAVTLFLTWILVLGVKESSRFNAAMVGIKLAVLAFFVVVAAGAFDLGNWFPAGASSKWDSFAPNGFRGILSGASIIFFAYIGFDAVSTAAEETRAPQRNMPIGILGSLAACTVIYIVVAVALTGILPWREAGVADPLAHALERKGFTWASAVVAFGAVVATTAVLLVFQLGQPRIFLSMARDGLLPAAFSRIHPRYRTPHLTTIGTGLFVAFFSALLPIEQAIDLTNIGTLFAFILVCGGVLVLRFTDPDRPRPFRTPLVGLTAPLGILCCLGLMLGLPTVTWKRFGLWLAAGLILYLGCTVWYHHLLERGTERRSARRLVGTVVVGLLVLGGWACARWLW